MKKIKAVLTILGLGLITLVLVSSDKVVLAKESSSAGVLSASSSSPSATVLEKFKSLLQGEIASKVAEFKESVAKVISNKAWPGQIESINEYQIRINVGGKVQSVGVDEYTIFDIPTKSKARASLKNLSGEDFIVALGDVDDTGVLRAKKVVKYLPKTFDKQTIWGQVEGISGSLIKIKTKDDKAQLSLGKDLVIQYGNDEGLLEDIKIDRFLVAVYEGSSSGSLKTKFIYIIPGPGIFKKTPSPSVSSSKSIVPSAKPR